ncbi:MAG: PAS domain-containing protein, partial [Natronospirillum sp.]
MKPNTPAYWRLFMHNALLLASSFGAILLVIVLLLFSLSFTALAPQMMNAMVRGYTDLPAGSDIRTIWENRADSLQRLPVTIEAVALYENNKLVGQFNRHPRRALPQNAEFLPNQASLPRLQQLQSLDPGGQWQLYVVANASLLNDVYRQTLIAVALICLLGALLVFLVSLRFQRAVAQPIHHLMDTARAVDREENFTMRAHKNINDDMGDLVDAFNSMLQRVESRDVQLQSERDRAEKAQVQAQTLARETRDANQRLEFEVQVRAKVERKLTEFQAYLNAMINSMPSALIAVDENALITQWNDEASRLSGRALDMALGYSLDEAIPLMKGHMDRLSRALLEKDIQRIVRVPYSIEDRDYLLDMVIY